MWLVIVGAIVLVGAVVGLSLRYVDQNTMAYLAENRLALLALVLAIVVLFLLPKWQVYRVRNKEETKGPLELQNEYRQTLVQIFGGIVVIATVYSVVEGAKTSRAAIEQSILSNELTRRAQVADRTFKAMEMLAKNEKNTDAKMAAIYVLSQVAKEDKPTEWTITEIFFNYLRLHSHSSGKQVPELPSPVAGAIVDYLRKRPWMMPVDGKETCIEYHQCIDYQKGGPSTENADYFNIINLPEVNLRGAFLEHVMLKKVILRDSHLEGVRLRCGHFEGSYLANAFLSRANASGSYWNWANLRGADLSCSVWHRADLTHTELTDAKLFGADLTNATVTKQQLEQADGDVKTFLSDENLRPARWPRKEIVHCRAPDQLEELECAK